MSRIIIAVLLVGLSANAVLTITLINAFSEREPAPVATTPAMDLKALEHRLTDTIDSQFEQVDMRVQQLESRLAAQAQAASAAKASAANTEARDVADTNDVYFEGPVDDVFAMGFVDEYAWNSMEQQIKSMSREENKRFWTKMLAGIQSGEIQMLDGE